MDPITTGVTTTEPATAQQQPESLDVSVEKSVLAKWERAQADESEGAGVEPSTGEPGQQTADAQPQKVPVTPEQLADSKYWGGLDKEGWARMERDYPVESKSVKSAYATASKIAGEARKLARAEAAQAPLDNDAEEAYRLYNSLNEEEHRRGMDMLLDIKIRQTLPKIGIDPVAGEAQAVVREAYSHALSVMPELADIADKDLDAVVDADEGMLDDLRLAATLNKEQRLALTSSVMRRAGRAVLANKQAAASATDAQQKAETAKRAAAQQRAKSNMNNPAALVADTASGRTPSAEMTMEEYVHKRWNAEAQRAAVAT